MELHHLFNKFQVAVNKMGFRAIFWVGFANLWGCSSGLRSSAPYVNTHVLLKPSTIKGSALEEQVEADNTKARKTIVRLLKKHEGETYTPEQWDQIVLNLLRNQTEKSTARNLTEVTERTDLDALRVGDLILFRRRPGTALSAVVLKRFKDGRILVRGPIRGTVTQFYVNPQNPMIRRQRSKIHNSFMRTVSQDDNQHGYLAGTLVKEVRTPAF